MEKYLRHPFLIVCARVVFGGLLTAIGFELGGDFMNVIFRPRPEPSPARLSADAGSGR